MPYITKAILLAMSVVLINLFGFWRNLPRMTLDSPPCFLPDSTWNLFEEINATSIPEKKAENISDTITKMR